MITRQMFETHPKPAMDAESLRLCLTACLDCAAVCSACADACLAERDVAELVRCIRTCLDASDLCIATARMLSRQAELSRELMSSQLDVCRIACLTASQECLLHAEEHEHCRICADACLHCDIACGRLGKPLRQV
jgi:hypothetical protein